MRLRLPGPLRPSRRPDWLSEIHGLLTLLLATVVVAGTATGVVALTGDHLDLTVRAAQLATLRSAPLPSGLALAPDGDLTLQVAHPDAAQRALAALGSAPTWGLWVLVLFLLRRLVREVRRTDPFTAPVARRLCTIATVMVAGGPLVEFVQFLASFALSTTVHGVDPQATLSMGFFGTWLLAGFGLLAVAEVVRRGQWLREELDTVV